MNDCRYNLLIDPLISVELNDGAARHCSLPELLVLAQQDAITDFPALRPHQSPAWHMFLVQLAVMAVEASGGDMPDDEMGWRNALRVLTADFPDDEPWCLVVANVLRPAFLQSPFSVEEKMVEFKSLMMTPDSMDVLATSKNHDLKKERMFGADLEDWMFSLINVQTTGGGVSHHYHPVARMNSADGNRPMVRVAPVGTGFGGQWLRDVQVLLKHAGRWHKQTDALGVGIKDPKVGLLWLLPWDGDSSLSLANFHPLGIELCRRLRLRNAEGDRFEAVGATSKVLRVCAKHAQGVVGDPWAPIDLRDSKKGLKVFTSTVDGFGYRRMSLLLDARAFMPAFLQQPIKEEQRVAKSMELVAAALTRGAGKTGGFHQRRILLGQRATMALASDDQRLAKRAQQFLELAARGYKGIFKPAIYELLGKKSETEWSKRIATSCQATLDAAIDTRFFDELDASFEAEENDSDAATRWQQVLASLIREQFNRAALALPRKGEGRYFAEARARNRLEGALRKEYPSLRQAKPSPDDHEQENADADIGQEHA